MRVPPWVEQRVTVDDGVVLWTASGGAGSIPLALCHGGAGLWDYLQPVADSLSAVAHVHRWEQRGCGRSDRAGPYTIERYVTDLECLRAHFGHAWREAYHHEADRRLDRRQRARRDALSQRRRTPAEEREWRILSYTPDIGDQRRACAIAAAFADAPYAINFNCNLDSVGHLPWLEDPAAFGAVARDFVAERGGSPCQIHRSPAD